MDRFSAFLRRPEGAIAIYAVVTLAATLTAYYALFSQFALYDDEGTVLIALKSFVGGEILYRDVYTPFGPFYYELFGGLFAGTGWDVTTEASRTIVMVIWVGSSLLLGLAVQRLTRQLALGVTAMLVAFTTVFILTQEPMHAQVLAVLLLALFTFLVAGTGTSRLKLAGAIAGALLAGLLLTKVNVGIYAGAAVAFAAALAIEPLHRRWWLRWPLVLAFLALPWVATGRDLSNVLVRNLALLETLAALAVAVAARTLWLEPRRGDESGPLRWLLAAAAGFALAAAAILGFIFLTGSTPADVYNGMITQALRVRDVNPAPLGSAAAAIDWGIAAIAGAALIGWLRARGHGGSAETALWSGLLRGLGGLTIWFTISQSAPLALGPAPGNPDALAAVLAWIAVIPPAGLVESPQKRFVRVLLPALAVAEVLQVYPVAGSQMRIAAVTFVVVGGICLGDAYTCLRTWADARGRASLERVGIVATVLVVSLGAKFAVDGVVLYGVEKAIEYRDNRALPFPGAQSMRLPAPEAESYEQIVALLQENRCTDFIGYANVDSLYLWSGIDPPRPSPPSAWMLALDEDEQNRILRQMKAAERPCAVRNETVANTWLGSRPRPETPLVRYIFEDFKPVAQTGPFELLLPGRSSALAS
jgi:hypothetical protein